MGEFQAYSMRTQAYAHMLVWSMPCIRPCAHFTKNINKIATSIKKEFNIDINTEEFIEELCNEFEKEIIERIGK